MRPAPSAGAAVAVLGTATLLLLVVSSSSMGGGVELMHMATFTDTQYQNEAQDIHGPNIHQLSKEDFLHANSDDRGGFPTAEYHKDDDADALSVDLSAAAKKVRLLSSREQAVRSTAAQKAAADLSNYDSVFSSGLDEYSKISHSIDEQSRKVFMRSLKPKSPPKPVYDPLRTERKLWKKMGVKADGVFGVPHEYAGWHATATANPAALKHLPDYVVRAQQELGGGAVAMAANGWHSHPMVPSRQRARAQSDDDDSSRSRASPAPPPPPSAPSSPFARTVGSYVSPPAAAP